MGDEEDTGVAGIREEEEKGVWMLTLTAEAGDWEGESGGTESSDVSETERGRVRCFGDELIGMGSE